MVKNKVFKFGEIVTLDSRVFNENSLTAENLKYFKTLIDDMEGLPMLSQESDEVIFIQRPLTADKVLKALKAINPIAVGPLISNGYETAISFFNESSTTMFFDTVSVILNEEKYNENVVSAEYIEKEINILEDDMDVIREEYNDAALEREGEVEDDKHYQDLGDMIADLEERNGMFGKDPGQLWTFKNVPIIMIMKALMMLTGLKYNALRKKIESIGWRYKFSEML